MKKFFSEFKKFITRGNIVDMAVGVIVGSSFTAIVNGLSNYVLKPIINWVLSKIMGANALEEMYTFLVTVETTDESGNKIVDLANSIYIDWGSFINAIINFFLVALVLFTIVKVINNAREHGKKINEMAIDGRPCKADRKEMKKRGIKFSNADAVAAYFEEKAAREAAEKAAAEEKARLEKEANPSTEELLKQIRDLLKESNKS